LFLNVRLSKKIANGQDSSLFGPTVSDEDKSLRH